MHFYLLWGVVGECLDAEPYIVAVEHALVHREEFALEVDLECYYFDVLAI